MDLSIEFPPDHALPDPTNSKWCKGHCYDYQPIKWDFHRIKDKELNNSIERDLEITLSRAHIQLREVRWVDRGLRWISWSPSISLHHLPRQRYSSFPARRILSIRAMQGESLTCLVASSWGNPESSPWGVSQQIPQAWASTCLPSAFSFPQRRTSYLHDVWSSKAFRISDHAREHRARNMQPSWWESPSNSVKLP